MPKITPTILYKHMRDFVEKDDVRPVFKHIWFDGEHAVATNTHVLCAVKYKTEPHFETTDGTPAELDVKFPVWERLMIKDKEAEACITLPSETLDNLSDWVRLLKFIVQATKKRGVKNSYQYHVLGIRKQGRKLILYFLMALSATPVKVELLDNLETGKDFQIFLNAEYLLNALSFIQDMGAETVDWLFRSIGMTELRAEGNNLRVVISGSLVRDSPDGDNHKLLKFIEEDTLNNEPGEEEDDDLSFLD